MHFKILKISELGFETQFKIDQMAGNRQCWWFPQAGEWVKGKVVGSGSFGIVHLAMNKANGALFVVKSAESKAGLKSLENESNILENLDSPYILKCIGKNLCQKKLDLFFEYMAGGSLADVAEKFGGTLEEKVIRLYTKEILRGLKYLHKNGIIHSDLKCKNVLLGSSGNIKLADFGCAKRLNHEDSIRSFGGTPLWMAPEVLRNEEFGFAADIWSLGCTVIEMATGKPPWSDDMSNPMAAVLKISYTNQTPKFPVQFSKEGLDFLTKCLERDLKKRWTSDELLRHPFVCEESVDRNSRKEAVSSPSSVLDVEMSNESPDRSETVGRIPFTRQKIDCHLVSSENWVTVRKG